MAKKKPNKIVKIQIEAGKATPAPPLGPALGQAGVNIGTFVNEFNEKTREIQGKLSVILRVYDDRSYDFDIRTPLTSGLIKRAIGVKKGSGKNLSKKAGSITKDQIRAIAEEKMVDINANDIDAAMKIVEGQCFSMGVEIK
jgi:large subunit ribosomal protein L11